MTIILIIAGLFLVAFVIGIILDVRDEKKRANKRYQDNNRPDYR
jgi:hypothetical protein